MTDLDSLQWDKGRGLLPAIVQHADTGAVLMLGFVNREALGHSLQSGYATFYSRTRQRLWTKGETSGNRLQIVSVSHDCDGDTVLMLALPSGPTCHSGAERCFSDGLPMLAELEEVIARKIEAREQGSYTAELAHSGMQRCAQKIGEEAVEVALAAATGQRQELAEESADLLYHLLVVLRLNNLGVGDIAAVLRSRRADPR